MARLQKKKVSPDKARKRETSPGVPTSENNSPAASPVKAGQKREDSRPAVVAAPSDPNFIQKWMEFLREVRVELKKVTWPSRKQTAGSTLVVIILVFILGAFLGLVDISLSKLVQIVLA
ncbi:MAG: preprotein translocase subunit SecE [Desulfobacterium sp.]